MLGVRGQVKVSFLRSMSCSKGQRLQVRLRVRVRDSLQRSRSMSYSKGKGLDVMVGSGDRFTKKILS